MTVTLRSAKANGYYIEISQEKYESTYVVMICPMYDESRCGYPTSRTVYDTMKKANKRFNYLKRAAERGDY